MGFISQFDLRRIIQEYTIRYFFETGTWKGDAVAFALQFPFEKIISAEIVPGIAREASLRFQEESKVKICEASSTNTLLSELPFLEGNCLFWLDAHFPGADAGLEGYDAMPDEEIRLPLEQELTVIHRLRQHFRDVIIVDDLRVYEDGPFENGAAPADTLPKNNRNLEFVNRLFGTTHIQLKSYKNEGYLLLVPTGIDGFSSPLSEDFFRPVPA
jgi:hypothetical protein